MPQDIRLPRNQQFFWRANGAVAQKFAVAACWLSHCWVLHEILLTPTPCFLQVTLRLTMLPGGFQLDEDASTLAALRRSDNCDSGKEV